MCEVLTMAEYIKKEDIEQKIQDGLNNLILGHDAIEVLGMIYEMPTADVAPVRHGRWLPIHSTAAGDIQYCSACEIGCTWKPNYCPNCGAKMDGDDHA